MIETPRIVDTTEQLAAVIHLTIPRSEIQQVMGPGFGEVMSVLAAQGIAPAGAFFSHHFRMNPETFDFEIGVPVATPVTASGRVTPGRLPAARVARTIYHGGYEGLGAAWGEFGEWVKANGLAPAENLWEIYARGPESGPDSSGWRTELNRPLVG